LFGFLVSGIHGADGLLDLLHPFGHELLPEFGQSLLGRGELLFRESHIVVRGFDAAVLIAPVGIDAAPLHFIGVGPDMGGRLTVDALVF